MSNVLVLENLEKLSILYVLLLTRETVIFISIQNYTIFSAHYMLAISAKLTAILIESKKIILLSKYLI